MSLSVERVRCPICMQENEIVPFHNDLEGRTHKACLGCIQQAVNVSPRCSICRATITSDNKPPSITLLEANAASNHQADFGVLFFGAIREIGNQSNLDAEVFAFEQAIEERRRALSPLDRRRSEVERRLSESERRLSELNSEIERTRSEIDAALDARACVVQ